MDYASRLAALRAAFAAEKCEALLVSNLVNVRYLCGFTGSSGMLYVSKNDAHFITDFRYQQQAETQVAREYSRVIARRGLWQEAAKIAKKKTRKKAAQIGFESEHTSVASWQGAQPLFEPAGLISTFQLVEKLRLQKDDDELEIMRRAIQVADQAMEFVLGVLRPGLSETEVASELLNQIKQRGASGPSFDFIVASGVRGALPHGVASAKIIDKGDMVTIDMGAIVDGYCSDMTRTVCVGKPTREQQKIYEIVWHAQTEASEKMRAGQSCKAADKVARDIISKAGYGEFFGHGLGHGVGMQIHEAPRVSQLGKGKLQTGSVVSCEPGIYIPDWGGVRIEDLLLIKKGGAEILNKASKPRKILVV
jgi:Xaa-Pro aminopeptidase